MVEKFVVCVMGDNCTKFIDMCFGSVIEADKIVFCWGKEDKKTKEKYDEWKNKYPDKFEIIENEFIHDDIFMISKQRNFYLDYLKENYKGWWCLVLDTDEVVENLEVFKKLVINQKWDDDFMFSPRMRHLIGNLNSEDSLKPVHHVAGRYFKVTDDKFYPKGEHTIMLSEKKIQPYPFNYGVIWHLGYLDNIWDIKSRYDDQKIRIEGSSHHPKFLKQWMVNHLFGIYPTKKFNPVEIPEVILNNFDIKKEEIYFSSRGIELKHFTDAIHWRDYFKCKDAVEFDCGKGPRVYSLNNVGVECERFDFSEYAVENKMDKNIQFGDITVEGWGGKRRDLVIAYDLLEHIKYEDLDTAIEKLIEHTKKHILISVPVIGNPTLEQDPTHIIKETRDWWIKKFIDKGLELISTPEHFPFKEQILIFKIKNGDK